MEKKLVSLITPCYNMSAYIHRLLQSVLDQTYPHIEMFVVDDGSTDNSFEIAESFKKRFQERGYQLTCIRQENSGQSAAIQNALPLVQGEYLAWPDSDDFYTSPNAISLMVERLNQASSEFAMVRCQEEVVEDGTFHRLYILGENAHDEEPVSLFEDCLFTRNGYYFCSGAYMVRFEALKQTTELSIYTHPKAGQNWQLMLPILYHYRCLTVRKVLYSVVARCDSHSRQNDYTTNISRIAVYLDTLLGTLERIKGLSSVDKERLKMELNLKYTRKLCFETALCHHIDDFHRYYSPMKNRSVWDRLFAFAVCSGIIRIPICRRLAFGLYGRYLNSCNLRYK